MRCRAPRYIKSVQFQFEYHSTLNSKHVVQSNYHYRAEIILSWIPSVSNTDQIIVVIQQNISQRKRIEFFCYAASVLLLTATNLSLRKKRFENFKLKWTIYFCSGLRKTAELLIQNGADVNVVGNDGKTALLYAMDQGINRVSFK